MENKDGILTTFVNTVDKTDLSMGITLNFSGQIISGNLISYKTYLQEIGSSFGSAKDEIGIGLLFEKKFKDEAEKLEKLLSDEDENETTSKKPNFIHMKDVKILGNKDDIEVPLWRGKLSSVDGFVIGTIIKD